MAEPASKKTKLELDPVFDSFLRDNNYEVEELKRAVLAVQYGLSKCRVRTLKVVGADARCPGNFSKAKLFLEKTVDLHPIGELFQKACTVLNNYIQSDLEKDDLQLPDDNECRRALALLLQYLQNLDKESRPLSQDSPCSFEEWSWTLKLAQHVLSKLSLNPHYLYDIDITYDARDGCPCLEHDSMLGRQGDTTFVTIAFCEEPQCSKFHYEAQTLDKMIRTEVKVEAKEKEILKTNQQVIETLHVLQAEREKIVKEYTDIKEKVEKEVQMEIERMNKDYAVMKERANTVAKTMSEDVKMIKDTLLTPTIAFKARGPADVSLETGQTLIFSTNMLNEGGAYDNVTGIFTAPVAGTYLFLIHLCTKGTGELYYGIVYDDTVYTSGRFHESNGYVCFVADAIMVLRAGQRVRVKCLNGRTSDALVEYSSTYNYWNTFSGVLLHI